MLCKNCGSQNPDNAAFCSNCGTPLSNDNNTSSLDATVAISPAQSKAEELNETVQAAPAAEEISINAQPEPQYDELNDTVAVNNSGSEHNDTAEAALADDVPYTPAVQNEDQYFEETPKKKKKKGPLVPILIIAIALLAVLAGCAAAFWPYITNTAMRLASPEKHQAFVYKNAAEELGNILFNSAMEDGDSNKGTVKVNLTDTAIELLEENVDEEFNYNELNEVEIDYNYSVKDNNQSIVATAKHPELELNAEIFANEKKEEITVLLPEFNDEALSIDADDLEIPLLPATAVMPEKKMAKRVLSQYAETFFLNAENVERGNSSYTINGKTTTTLCFKTEVTEELVTKAALSVLEEAKDDKELEEYFDDVLLPYIDAEDDYADGIDALIEDLEDSDANDETAFYFYTYINAKGEIVAIEIELGEEEDNLTILAGRYKKGKNVIYGIVAESDSEGTNSAILEGTLVRGKLNADVEIIIDDEEMLTVKLEKFDIKSLKKGYSKGKATIGGAAFEEIADDPAFRNLEIIMEWDTSKNGYESTITVAAADGELGTINCKGKYKKAKKIELHEDTNDDQDEWTEDLDEDVLEDLEDIFIN